MANLDESIEWLLVHARQAFITSDDTGMCETCIQDNDTMTLNEHIQRRKELERERGSKFKPFTYSTSPGVRLQMNMEGRGRSETAVKLEKIKKEREKKVNKRYPWQVGENGKKTEVVVAAKASEATVKQQKSAWDNLEVGRKKTDEEEKGTEKKKEKKPSFIAKLLRSKTDGFFCQNPFESYLRFEGSPQDGVPKSFQVFVHTRAGRNKAPVGPIQVDLGPRDARIEDVAGLTLWKYVAMKMQPPLKYKDAFRYVVFLAEDEDGEVMSDFPMIHGSEPALRIGFSTLAVCEDNLYDEGSGSASGRTYPVIINHINGQVTVRVRSVGTRMSDILKKAMQEVHGKEVKLGRYVLQYMEKKDAEGEYRVVDEKQTLKSTETFTFFLIREHSARV